MLKRKKDFITIIRITAKVWSAIIIVLVTLFMLGHLFFPEEDTLPMKLVEGIAMIFFPFGVLIGMGISWKRELEGALITIISVVIFYILIALPRGAGLRMFPAMFIIAGPSILFLSASLLSRIKKKT